MIGRERAILRARYQVRDSDEVTRIVAPHPVKTEYYLKWQMIHVAEQQ